MNKKALILFTVSAVVVLAAASGLQYQSKNKSRSVASVSQGLSFLKSGSVLKKVKIKDEISFDCEFFKDEVKKVSENSEVVMLKFKKCDTPKNKKIVGYKIVNQSNGYEGQIFQEKLTHLSTDYMQLNLGENLIELEISLIDGQKINKKIKINR